MAVKLIHKHSRVEFKNATGAQLDFGELALNYNESGPYLQCKDASGEVVQLGGVFFGEDNDPPGDPLPGKWWLTPAGKLYLFNGASWVEVAGGSSGGGGGSLTVLGGDGIETNTIGSTVTVTADIDENKGLDIEGAAIAIKIGANLSFDADGKLQASSSGLSYKGLCNVTSSTVVLNPSANDLYSNTGTGKFSSQWAAITENADTTTDASEGDLMAFNGSEWNLLPRSSSSVGTDLGIADLDATDFVITSSTGADAKLPPATTTTAGVMTAEDKTAIDNIGDGLLIVNDSEGNEVGTFTANQATGTNTVINLPEGFSGDYDDLTNLPTIGDGTITLKSDGTEVGTFTVNQVGDKELNIPATAWGDVTDKPIYIDTNEPGSPSNGDIWVDLNECPPEVKIWSDCSGTGQWEGIEGTPPVTVLAPTLSGNAAQNEILTSSEGQAVGGKPPFTYVYNFQDENDSVLQATAARTYTLLASDVGKTVTVTVTATDSRGTIETSEKSNAIGPVVPPETVNAPTLLTPADGATDVSNTSVTLSCSAYSGVASVYGTTTWEVSSASDFSVLVYDVTNTDETSTVASFTLAFETTYYARCKHTSSTGIASAYSNVNSFETQADPVDPNVPSATMSGLRFDSARKTYLQNENKADSTFTFSCWSKLTNVNDTKILLGAQGSAYINIVGDVYSFNGSPFSGSPTATLNKWEHVCAVFTNEGVTLYIDGVIAGTNSNTDRFNGILIGSNGSGTQINNGYLSEVYLAEEVLPPTAFGKTFPDGRWGPLDSDVIKDNINNAPKLPDGLSNTSQVWSSSLTGTFSNGSPLNVFDGASNAFATGVTVQGNSMVFAPVGGLNVVSSFTFGYSTSQTTQYKINGGDYVPLPSTSGDVVKTIYFTGTLNSFEWNAPTTGELVNVYYFSVDDRLLVDQGVWNNSQNWSANNTGFAPATPASNAFNGNINPADASYRTYADGMGTTATITFASAVTVSTSLRVFIGSGNTSSEELYINGNLITGITYPTGDGAWVTVPGISSITSIGVGRDNTGSYGDYVALAAVEVDGAILVDAGATWNTSQVWSDNTTDNWNGNSVPAIKNMFDGSLTTYAHAPGNGSASIEFTGLTANSSIRVYAGINKQTSWEITLGGTAYFIPLPSTFSWIDITSASFPVSLDKIENLDGTGQMYAIEVDGEVLVDKASFGANGFYLPFDPSNTGGIYTGSYTGSPFEGNWNNVFNGVKGANSASTVSTYTSSGDTTMTLTTPFSGNLTVYASANAGTGDPTGAEVILTTGSGAVSVPCAVLATGNPAADHGISAGAVSNVTAITLKQSATGTKLYWLELDGALLVDHNSIGVDASGNQNNFVDQNFGVGNTSQVWSNSTTRPGTTISTVYTPINMFDGSLSTDCRQDPESSPILFEPTGLSYASSLRVHVTSVNNANQVITVVTSTGTENKIGNTFGPNGASVWVEFTANPGTIISVSQVTDTGLVNAIQAVEVDGVVLVNPSSLDTVTDTPLKSYAVLEVYTGDDSLLSNGNLTFDTKQFQNAQSTLTMTSGKYYFEAYNNEAGIYNKIADINNVNAVQYVSTAPCIVGMAFDVDNKSIEFFVDGISSTTETMAWDGPYYANFTGPNTSYVFANFGQQPLAASNVTYDQATGIATIGGVEYNTLFQTWDEWATLGLFFFNENTGKTITSFELNRKYGLTVASPDAGIYNLTFQPRARVFDYLKQATSYLPLEDLLPQLEATQATLASTQADLDAAQAALITATEDIAENLAAFAALVARVETLENP